MYALVQQWHPGLTWGCDQKPPETMNGLHCSSPGNRKELPMLRWGRWNRWCVPPVRSKKKDFETFRLQEEWWLLLPLFTSLISLFVLVCLEYSNLSQDGPYKLIEPQKMLEPTQLAFAGPKKMKKLRRGQGSFAKFGYFSRGKAGMCCSYFKGFAPTGGFTSHV